MMGSSSQREIAVSKTLRNTVKTDLHFMRQEINAYIEKTYPMSVDFKVQVKNRQV